MNVWDGYGLVSKVPTGHPSQNGPPAATSREMQHQAFRTIELSTPAAGPLGVSFAWQLQDTTLIKEWLQEKFCNMLLLNFYFYSNQWGNLLYE